MTVEDVHWADADTLGLLAALSRATTRSRTAVVMTTRVGADPLDAGLARGGGDGLQLTFDLTPLAPAEAETIARSFPAAEVFAAKCVERAGGNPLFLEQLLRTAGDLVDGRLPSYDPKRRACADRSSRAERQARDRGGVGSRPALRARQPAAR